MHNHHILYMWPHSWEGGVLIPRMEAWNSLIPRMEALNSLIPKTEVWNSLIPGMEVEQPGNEAARVHIPWLLSWTLVPLHHCTLGRGGIR